MRFAVLVLPLLLAACASPRENCERAALDDLRNIDALIRETSQNIQRGYGYESETVVENRLRYCLGGYGGGRVRTGIAWCNHGQLETRDRPVALDLKAERAKLAELKAKRPETLARAQRQVRACRARYPQG